MNFINRENLRELLIALCIAGVAAAIYWLAFGNGLAYVHTLWEGIK